MDMNDLLSRLCEDGLTADEFGEVWEMTGEGDPDPALRDAFRKHLLKVACEHGLIPEVFETVYDEYPAGEDRNHLITAVFSSSGLCPEDIAQVLEELHTEDEGKAAVAGLVQRIGRAADAAEIAELMDLEPDLVDLVFADGVGLGAYLSRKIRENAEETGMQLALLADFIMTSNLRNPKVVLSRSLYWAAPSADPFAMWSFLQCNSLLADPGFDRKTVNRVAYGMLAKAPDKAMSTIAASGDTRAIEYASEYWVSKDLPKAREWFSASSGSLTDGQADSFLKAIAVQAGQAADTETRDWATSRIKNPSMKPGAGSADQ